MQDTSVIPQWNPTEWQTNLINNPLDQKNLKSKLEKIYLINHYNQSQYIPDTLEAYIWIKLVKQSSNPLQYFVNQKVLKWFYEQFIGIAIRYMILCRRFSQVALMALTQQIIIEGIRIFKKMLPQIDKYPKLLNILKNIFDYDKQFYKINSQISFPYRFPQPKKDQIIKNQQFLQSLKIGNKVDLLKLDHHTKRFCWLQGTVRKISSMSVQIICDFDNNLTTYDRRSFQIQPHQSKSAFYQWRYNLQVGSKVDYQHKNSSWIVATITQIRQSDQQGLVLKQLLLQFQDGDEVVNLCDSRIQQLGTITSSGTQPFLKRSQMQSYIDDYNDVILDPEVISIGVTRGQYTRSQFYIDLINILEKQQNICTYVLDAIQNKKINVQHIAQLSAIIAQIHPMLHRKFAIPYLTRYIQSLLLFVKNAEQQTIRNFSKQRVDAVLSALSTFSRRIYEVSQRNNILVQIQLKIILRFLQSDFLDRKLYAVSSLTHMLAKSKKQGNLQSINERLQWVKTHKIISKIYNQKSHSQLISRSTDFLLYFLISSPAYQQLTPLLEWNQEILKVISQNFQYFPQKFKEEITQKIKSRNNVKNKHALDIVKKSANCQLWLLSNGGQSWVSVVEKKTKRKSDIYEVFNQQFAIVQKVTKDVADLYDCKFKTQYFYYMNQSGYIPRMLSDNSTPFTKRVELAALAIQYLAAIKQQLFQALAPHAAMIDNLQQQTQQFFINILPKISNQAVRYLFDMNFGEQNLIDMKMGKFNLFKNCFLKINEEEQKIKKKITTKHKKQKVIHYTILEDPNNLIGMNKLKMIVQKGKQNLVCQAALQFIGFLFDRISKDIPQADIIQCRSVFLQSCLQGLYNSTTGQQKYLRMVEGLLDQSQKSGIDELPSVNSLFLNQNISVKLIDHFNVNKSRSMLRVNAGLTLYEMKCEIAKMLNAYPHQFKLYLGQKQLQNRFNGRIVHSLGLCGGQITAQRIVNVQKVSLLDDDMRLNQKCKNVFRKIFKQFSQLNLMSKAQCQKYYQRCVGQVSVLSESRVQKIYDQYDKDKDGYLTQQEFMSFYQNSAKLKQMTVWSNLERFGIRNDLQDLTSEPIVFPPPQKLVRNHLIKNQTFMTLLIKLMQDDNLTLAQAAWKVASRLPLFSHQLFFQLPLDLKKPFLFRYWLYYVLTKQNWDLLTKQVLEIILNSDSQTNTIGLQAAIYSDYFDESSFKRILLNLKKINGNNLSFHSQVLLDKSLKIIQYKIKENENIRKDFIQNQNQYQKIFTNGLLSKNITIRQAYCQTITSIVSYAANASSKNQAYSFQLFEILFKLVYNNFEQCDKTTLSFQYFKLYSQLLEVLKQNNNLLSRLSLDWLILSKSMISLFTNHQTNQTGLNSSPDQIALGYLRILQHLLRQQTVNQMVPLVKFLFQQSLFPDSGSHKLKNTRSRKQAYDLLVSICQVRDSNGQSIGLRQLFEAGFKSIYKKVSAGKTTSSYGYSHYFSYNEARSELGYAGIRNLGCICYMIAMLQQLFMTQSFRSLILMADDNQPTCLTKKGTKQVDDNIFHQLQSLFANLELTQKQDYNPQQFCFAFKDFEGMPVNVSVQQDAQQFLNIFFDKIENSLKGTPFVRVVEDIFGGKTCNQTVCNNCKSINQRYQGFYPLSLEIKGYKNIHSSFQKFIQGQVISDYQCDACNKKTDVTRSCILAKVPNYFVVHLQRICFNYDKFENEKVNSRWQFPMNLNVYDYTLDKQNNVGNKQQYQFSLRGIVLHYGTAQFGHYFSYIKQSQNRWLQFNDERVKQLDPSDIEADCFGGQNWRRESQSAYLLVYEKVKKNPIRLQFNSKQSQQKILKQFRLSQSLFQVKQQPKQQLKQQQVIQIKQKQQKPQDQPEATKQQPKQQIFISLLTPTNIPQYVPQQLKQKIYKSNQQFSFTLNVSNDQFAHFLHKILSINPPQELTTQFLQLCYQCFQLKTIIDQQEGITLCDWAAKRFRQIIGGHGLQFMRTFGQNWQSDILSIQKPTRVGVKNLLLCVLIDIINSQKKSTQEIQKQKSTLINQFLHRFTQMLLGEVSKHWIRFAQYFSVWSGLIKECSIVRFWCKQIKMIERLLDFVMEEHSPFSKTQKKYALKNHHYGADLEHPLQVLGLLINHGLAVTQAQKKCMRHYAFLQKIIKHQIHSYNMIQLICSADRPLSQKFAYLALHQANKVNQSDQIKPIISALLQFLSIKDGHEQERVKWIVGVPQYIQNIRTGSFGIFGINPENDKIIEYISPLRTLPMTQLVYKYKIKAQHVCALMLTFLLQIENDGYVNNLDQLPSPYAFTQGFFYWGKQFVQSYYQDVHRTYIAKHYGQYGDRLKYYWENRPNRPYNKYPNYLIGRTQTCQVIKQQKLNQMIQLQQIDVNCAFLEMSEQNSFLSRKNIKKFSGNDDFKIKNTNSYSHYGSFSTIGGHSDEQDIKDVVNPFEKVQKAYLFRKLIFKNISQQHLLTVITIKSLDDKFSPKQMQMSKEIKSGSTVTFVLKRHEAGSQIVDIQIGVKVLGVATRQGFWPRQLITQVQEQESEDDPTLSDGDDKTWSI